MPETTPQPTPVTRALADYFSVQAKPKSLFLGPPMGLIENMDNSHPAIWDLYKKLKSMDWDETEIDISSCREEFKTRPQEAVRLMKSTLAFQFEGDSNAAHIARLMYPFINNTELMCYITELAKNECLHALSYKFIVESSFEDPNDFLKEVREIKEAFIRLDNVNTIFQELLEVGAKYTLGMITDEAAIRKILLKAWVSLYALERIQFISSFAVTFSLAEQGLCESMFVPIAKLVQKISTDEWNIHVDADKAVLRNELSIPDVFALWLEILPEVQAIVDSVVAAEVKWLTDYLFKDSSVTVGIERDSIIAFVQYTAQDVYDFLKLPITWARHTTNPLPLMEKWLSIDNNQASPQEESIGNYLLGGLIDDTDTVNANRYAGLGVTL